MATIKAFFHKIRAIFSIFKKGLAKPLPASWAPAISFHNIFRLFDVLPNLPITTSETMGDYYL